MNDSTGTLLPTSINDFASMSADLVRYYNTGGFEVGGTHFQSPSPYPITWWGIFNEPNGNGLTPQDVVILSPPDSLLDHVRVRVVTARKPSAGA